MPSDWPSHQALEASWWGDCANTYGEETKQLVYARHMGLSFFDRGGPGPTCDLDGKSVIDLGGGPSSLLLKCENFDRAVVVEPCPYPAWVADRYSEHGVVFWRVAAEEATDDLVGPVRLRGFDEAWIYNVLQHVQDPAVVIANARRLAPTVRIFEWLNVPAHPGHPHVLTAEALDEALAGSARSRIVGYVNEGGAVGLAYCGLFMGATPA